MKDDAPREIAVRAIAALLAGDGARLAALLASDARLRIAGDFAHSRAIDGRSEIVEFISAEIARFAGGGQVLRFEGTIRRLVAEGNLVAAEIAGAPDYALIVHLEAAAVMSVTLYFDTLAYTGDRIV